MIYRDVCRLPNRHTMVLILFTPMVVPINRISNTNIYLIPIFKLYKWSPLCFVCKTNPLSFELRLEPHKVDFLHHLWEVNIPFVVGRYFSKITVFYHDEISYYKIIEEFSSVAKIIVISRVCNRNGKDILHQLEVNKNNILHYFLLLLQTGWFPKSYVKIIGTVKKSPS